MRCRSCARRIMFSLSSLVTALSCRAAEADTGRFVTWTYKEAPMGLYLPAPLEESIPVVMFLHGCHNDPVHPGHWIIQALNDVEPTAVFLPTAPETPGESSCADWGGTYDAKIRPQMQDALHELDSLLEVFGLDAARQYLYGESMGGEGVYRLLMDFPTRFAGAVTVAGYTVNRGAAQMAKTPLWIAIGSADELSPVADTRAIVAAIEEAGGTRMKYTEYPDLGHVPAIETARTDSAYLTWLLGQRRSTGTTPDRNRPSVFPRRDFFAIENGMVKMSSSLPAGTRLTFADLQGRSLLVVDAGNQSIRLPRDVAGRVVLWQARHSSFVASGKSTLIP